MTLRRKFILALVSMVVFMGIVSGSIALRSVNLLLDRSINYVQQGYTNQWNQMLVSYYEQLGSWDGVEFQVLHILGDPRQREGGLARENMRVLVFDKNFNVVASKVRPDIGRNITQLPNGKQIKIKMAPIEVDKETVGYLWLEDSFASRTDFLSRTLSSSIIRAMVLGFIITLLVVLLLGIILSRRMTEPLKRLTEAVTNVGKGDLSTRITPEGSSDIIALTEAFNQMTAQLARNEEVRTKMVADIAHELRTPLTIISGKLESIQEGVVAATPETVLPIQDEVIRMTRLVRDLQHLSLAEAGKLPLALQEVNLEDLIKRILEHFETALEEKKIIPEVTGEAVPVLGDADRLTQVFVNLIDNALRHSPLGGTVAIHLQKAGWQEASCKDTITAKMSNFGENQADSYAEDGVLVMIQDSGEGIPEEDLPRVFDRFYRVDQARDRSSGGTGLGLAIAKEFIQAHGGQLSVASKVGEGTSFTVWLPLQNLPKS